MILKTSILVYSLFFDGEFIYIYNMKIKLNTDENITKYTKKHSLLAYKIQMASLRIGQNDTIFVFVLLSYDTLIK